jgi:hypothetical protein
VPAFHGVQHLGNQDLAKLFPAVILSDEVAVATEESKDPYYRQQSLLCQAPPL